MKIAVTGAAGHLGSRLCESLAAEDLGDLIRIDMRELPPGPGEARVADLSDEDAARRALEGAELLVHCASVHPWRPFTDAQYLDLNVKATWHVYAAARDLGVGRVVLTSSIAAAGYEFPPEQWPVSEEAEAVPGDVYSLTKHTQEVIARQFAQQHGIATAALRPPAFMPRGPLETGLSLLGHFALVEDIVSAHLAAVRAESLPEPFEPFFIVNALPYGPEDADIVDDPWAAVDRHWPGAREWFARRTDGAPWVHCVYSIERARRLLGWTPRYDFAWWWETQRAGL